MQFPTLLQQRGAFRESEKQRKDSEAAREQAAREAQASKLEAELTGKDAPTLALVRHTPLPATRSCALAAAAIQALSESDPVAARSFNAEALEARKRAKALADAADVYDALEAALMRELGVKPEEITPLAAAMTASTGMLGSESLEQLGAADNEQQHSGGSPAALQERGVNSPGVASTLSLGSPMSPAAAASPAAKRLELRPPVASGAASAMAGGSSGKPKIVAPLAAKVAGTVPARGAGQGKRV
jgi:hypothetical protein